jgi:protein-S-isoprenylcysteine O-methyltransferase Ste14
MTRCFYRFRGYLVTPPILLALFCFRWETEADSLIWPFGIGLVFLGFILRIWAQQHLHYGLKVRMSLTTTGPYSFIRNPLYVGNMFLCLGAVITSELLWLAPITLFYCFSIYFLVVRYEEDHLLKKYGEPYQRYLSEIPRWLPRRIRFRNLGLINRYFLASVIAEIHCVFSLLPFALKELVWRWIQHSSSLS